MKNFKKLMALVIAAVMVMGAMNLSVFAEGEKQIHVQGIKSGDTVYYQKVIQMNKTTGKWEWAIDNADLTDAMLTEIVGHYDSTTHEYVDGAISEQTAATIANIVKDNSPASVEATATTLDINGATGAEEGLYCLLITSGDVNTVYNPGFAAIQYEQTGATENTNSTIDFANLTYSDTHKAKKSTITVNKVAQAGTAGTNSDASDDKATTNNVGDIITFTVTTTIPAFGKNFTTPKYIVSDNMSAGLEFQSISSIKVGGQSVDTTTGKVADTTYISSFTPESGADWTLTFDPTYLLTNTTTVPVEVIYTAKVTNDAVKNINPDTNDVSVEFSNNPKDISESKKIHDETRHYTFSIDMGLLGNDEYSTSEFVKIGVDNDGNPIMASKTMDNQTVTHPLSGAKFKIFKEDGETPYSNELITASQEFTTTADGKLNIQGLDAGNYVLVETEAPSGFIPDKTPIPVSITATYETISVDPDNKAGTGDEYTYEALKTYTITVGGVASTYTMTNSGVQKDKVVTSSDQTKEWLNTKGVNLPSTGGMGTTLFYAIGAVLVLGAGILLVSKRRMSAN